MTIADALVQVRQRIARACEAAKRDPAEVTLVAVSKRQADERLHAAYAAGHRDFGENFVQELVRKQAMLPDARWHLIGHLQTNKVKQATVASMIHTVDSERLIRKLGEVGVGDVLIQVNIDDEATKAGVSPEEAQTLVTAAAATPGITVAGLMCIPGRGGGRTAFAAMRHLRDDIQESLGVPLVHLSMGMSDDFEDAIAEGATIVRVGTALFGERTL